MAMGLNHYLKYYCLTTVSWYADIAVEIPEELPMVGEKVVSEARVDTRFFLNYCTYGYTMPWWQWKDGNVGHRNTLLLHGTAVSALASDG